MKPTKDVNVVVVSQQLCELEDTGCLLPIKTNGLQQEIFEEINPKDAYSRSQQPLDSIGAFNVTQVFVGFIETIETNWLSSFCHAMYCADPLVRVPERVGQ